MQRTKAVKPQPNNQETDVKLRGKNGFKYAPKWAVIIPCDSEEKQQQAYKHLHGLGYKCRVVNV